MQRLTLTYGVAPGPRRTLTISLGRANLVLGVVSFATLWTLASLIYLATRWVSPAATGDVGPAAAVAQTAVVRSVAQPVVQSVVQKTVEPAAAQQLTAPPTVVQPSNQQTAVSSALPAATALAPSAAPSYGPPATVGPPAALRRSPELPAALSGFRLIRGGRQLVAAFFVENLSPMPLAGVVEGHAVFRRADGREQTVTASASFRARMRSPKELGFPLPPADGAFTSIQVVVRGGGGAVHEEAFPVP
jgi:hypothetical protein